MFVYGCIDWSPFICKTNKMVFWNYRNLKYRPNVLEHEFFAAVFGTIILGPLLLQVVRSRYTVTCLFGTISVHNYFYIHKQNYTLLFTSCTQCTFHIRNLTVTEFLLIMHSDTFYGVTVFTWIIIIIACSIALDHTEFIVLIINYSAIQNDYTILFLRSIWYHTYIHISNVKKTSGQ
jgi:hypothetical protein